ncbi:MAG: hypothetical protein C0424_00620 [Sphingobacteriaceae bacterium]|nr:hypothetical protein [Sphingobacteriaceae bacterium]
MKKLLLLLFVASLGLTATSCKKDYTCECVVGAQTIPTAIPNSSKGDAETFCNTQQTQLRLGSPSATCTLK